LNNQNLAKLEATQRRATSTTSSSKGQAMSISNLDNEGIQHSHTSVVDKNGRKLDLTFEDSQTAFKSKSTLQLLRGYLVFQLCSSSLLVNNQKLVFIILLFRVYLFEIEIYKFNLNEVTRCI
jgi:hypothetical protein